MIYALDNTVVNKTDNMERFPVHIAALHGAFPDVIDFLVRTNIVGANKLDSERKSVLHHLFNDYRRKYHTFTKKKQGAEQMYDLIVLLCDISPSSLLAEDQDGMNVLEYAIIEEADEKIVKKLQKTAVNANNYYRRRSSEKIILEWETESYGICSSRRSSRRSEKITIERKNKESRGIRNSLRLRLSIKSIRKTSSTAA